MAETRIPVKGKLPVNGFKTGSDMLTIAVSAKAEEFPEKTDWARENNFAIEYTPDPLHPELIKSHVSPYTDDGIPVRFHTRFFDFELGDEDAEAAARALNIHKQVIDEMPGLGEPNITVHLNLNKKIGFSQVNAVENLKALTDHANEKGITVCLENLKAGPTSDPQNVLNWAKEAGSMITLDMGHAVSSDYVNEGKMSVARIVDLFAPRLMEVHMYAKESDRHYPIEDISSLASPIEHLLETGCRWWTVELDDHDEVLSTREKLVSYLDEKRKEK